MRSVDEEDGALDVFSMRGYVVGLKDLADLSFPLASAILSPRRTFVSKTLIVSIVTAAMLMWW